MERRLAAILAADVVGYSRLMEQDEADTFQRLRRHRKELFEPDIEKHHGRIFKLMGDGLLAEFASVVDAVGCAVVLQRSMAERNDGLDVSHRIDVRVGVNLGDIIVEKDAAGREDIFGDGVNIAARLQELAEPGGICVSRTVINHVRNKIPISFEPMGDHTLKNMAEPVSVYRVVVNSAAGTGVRVSTNWSRPRRLVPSVAVLPFDNMSGDVGMGYFSDGVTEDIISMLSRLPDLSVIARNSTFTYKGKAVDVRQIARDLDVEYVLEGSVRKAGDKVRIVAQFVNAHTGQHVWAERYDNEGNDPWALQDEVTTKIVSSLAGEKGQIRHAEYKQAWGKDTAALEEYDYYLRGHDIYMRAEEKDEHNRAGRIWEEGLAKFPGSSLLLVKLAWFHLTRAFSFWSDDPPSDYRRAGELGRQVLSRENLPPHTQRLAHWLMAFVRCREGDFERALDDAEAAISLAPYDAFMLGALSQIPIMAGKPNQAFELLAKASAGNPQSQKIYSLRRAWAYYTQGHYEKALEMLREGPKSVEVPLLRASCQFRLGRVEEARVEVNRALTIDPQFSQKKVREKYFYNDPAILERQVADLGAAGLPEK
jgi:adenylate cyclase